MQSKAVFDNSSRFFIAPVGSSIFAAQNRTDNHFFNELIILKENELENISNTKLFHEPPSSQISFEAKLLSALESTGNNNKLSAELGTLILSYPPVNKSDTVQLLSIDTVESIIAARVISTYLNKHYGCTANSHLIHGLQIEDIERLEAKGFPNLVKHIFNEKETIGSDQKDQLILVATGAYKPVSNYLTVLGLILGVPVLYHFEEGTPLYLPGIKLKPDCKPWLNNIELFKLFERKGSLKKEEIEACQIKWDKPELSPFINLIDEKLTLTAFGNILAKTCRQIYFDKLTGIWSKNYLDDVVEMYCSNCKTIGIVMFDLDAFKVINDNFGHPVGDLVLANLAQKASEHLEKRCAHSAIVRYGGDEFITFLPGASLEETNNYINELCKEINNNSIIADQRQISVTISAGASILDNTKGLDIRAVTNKGIKEASKKLLEIKRNKQLP